MSADVWGIQIDNQVANLDPDTILCNEASCRTGELDINSPTCVDALKRVRLNPRNAVYDPNVMQTILVNPINAAQERTSGLGDFLLKSNYTLVLSHHYTQFVNDPDQDLLNSLTNPYWGSKVNASQTGRISPFALVNLSASYQINQRASVSLIVNNVFNSIKQDTSAGWPYYPVGNYNPYGRQGWLEFNYHCGS